MVTPLVVHRRRKYPLSQHRTDRQHRLLDTVPQALGEDHFTPSPGAVVIDRPSGNHFRDHLFQTNGLCAHLKIIVRVFASRPVFVLDGVGRVAMKLNHIGLTHQTKTLGPERVLFGSEYPLQDPAAELLKIDNLPLPAAEVAMIRGGNAASLIARGHDVR